MVHIETTLNTMSFISRKSLRLLAILLVLAQGARADVVVTGESALRSALADGGVVKLGNDISLSGTLVIDNQYGVILELNGHDLKLPITNATVPVVRVEEGGKLTIRNGSASDRGQITGSWGEQNQPNTSCGIYNSGTLTLDGIYVYQNRNTSMGAGITNHGVLTMTNTVVEGNRSQQGGGIFNAPGATLSMEGGAITGNIDYQSAGGLYNAGTITKFKNVRLESNTGRCIFNAGTMSMEGGTVQGGNTNGYPNNYKNGGGIYNNDNGTLTISGTTISSNNAPNGGGIYNEGHLTISNDARITNNSNGTDGGGIYNAQGGIVEMTGGSITGNHSESGCYNYGTMTLTNVSITNNVGPSSDNSHGLFNVGTLTLDGCMVSGHTSLFGAGIVNIGTLDMKGNTFIKENTTTENSGRGAGVYNEGLFTMSGGYITGNTSPTPTGKGGGIFNNSQDSGDKGIYMTGGTIVSNTAAEGGGIYNNSGTIIIAGGNVGEPTRGNTAAGSGGGIYNSATLSLTSGTIHGNTAYQGGGVFNGAGGHMLMTGGTIVENEAGLLGGGICNYATLTLEGGRIYENTCEQDGGGVWADGSIGSVLYMKGNPVVSGNLKKGNPNNVALGLNSTQEQSDSARIRVTGAFTAGADVHVRSEASGLYQITQDFGGEHNPKTVASSVFTDDAAADYGLSINQGEVYRMPLEKSIKYLQDGSQTCDAMKLSDVADGSGVSFGSGWFVLDDSKTYANRITILGDTHLILTNSKTLTASAGIYVPEWSSLTIHAQPTMGTVGSIIATGSANNAGIGGNLNQDAGTITVYGGKITATGGAYAAGIGGGGAYADNKSAYTTINIYGGDITATGGISGAGIGTGCVGMEMIIAPDAVGHPDVLPNMYLSHINVTGGIVRAFGTEGGAGIGSGADSYFLGEITISGGTVSGVGSDYILSTNANHYCSAAGIGSGRNGSCYLFRNPNAEPMERRAIVRISGGTVTATGGKYGAAGIGGGSRTYTNPVIDPSTYTAADCPNYYGGGADVFITGGTVTASGGNYGDATHWGDAIGCGGSYYTDNTVLPTRGTLEIYDGAAVSYMTPELVSSYAEVYKRVEAARDYYKVTIQPCEHNSGFYAYDHLQHSTCSRCFGSREDHTFDGNKRCTACGLVSLADNSNDNAAHIASLTGSTKRDVALAGRTLYKDGLWNTLCLPFSLTAEQLAASPLEGATIKAFSGASFSDGTLTLDFSADQQTITAGVPYIVKWAAGSNIVDPLFRQVSLTSAAASGVTSEFATTTSTASITFQGIYDAYATGGEDKSILFLGASTGGQSELYYPDSEMTIHALRAYFKLNGIEAGGLPEFDVRAFVLNFDGDEDPTSVSLPSATEAAGAWYDLSGRKVNSQFTIHNSQLSRGVYIHNGRKVVVK